MKCGAPAGNEHFAVFTCFGSLTGTGAVAAGFQHPLLPEEAHTALERIESPRGSVGHHRIQPGVRGARLALVSACAHQDLFREVLLCNESFDARYKRLTNVHPKWWWRTTIFDLLLRAGALGIGGKHYRPELAYLDGSKGPKEGFRLIFGTAVGRENAVWAEAVLRAWIIRRPPAGKHPTRSERDFEPNSHVSAELACRGVMESRFRPVP
jgi:hypothetical protein